MAQTFPFLSYFLSLLSASSMLLHSDLRCMHAYASRSDMHDAETTVACSWKFCLQMRHGHAQVLILDWLTHTCSFINGFLLDLIWAQPPRAVAFTPIKHAQLFFSTSQSLDNSPTQDTSAKSKHVHAASTLHQRRRCHRWWRSRWFSCSSCYTLRIEGRYKREST